MPLWFNSPDEIKEIPRDKSTPNNGICEGKILKWGLVYIGSSDIELKTVLAGKALCALEECHSRTQ